jgi:hypothetical protein
VRRARNLLFWRQGVVALGGKDVPDKALLRTGEVMRALGVTRRN